MDIMSIVIILAGMYFMGGVKDGFWCMIADWGV